MDKQREWQHLTDEQRQRIHDFWAYLMEGEFDLDLLEQEFGEYMQETGLLEDE